MVTAPGRSLLDKAELARFAVVGGTSAAFYLVVLYATKEVLPLTAASVVAYAAAMVVNYAAQRLWTFKSRRRHREAMPRYVVTHCGGIAINAAILAVFTGNFGLPLLAVQFAAFATVAAWSYLLQKLWVFRGVDAA